MTDEPKNYIQYLCIGRVLAFQIAGEAYVHAYRFVYGVPIVMARINNIYGPNQWDVKVSKLCKKDSY